jgi:hypothetical protein
MSGIASKSRLHARDAARTGIISKFAALRLNLRAQVEVAAVIKSIGKDGREALQSLTRRDAGRLRTKLVGEALVSAELPLVLGGCFKWEFLHPGLVLQLLCKECKPYKRLLTELYRKTPCTRPRPWHMCWYTDEAVPGNVLKPDNGRKAFVWNFTIRELRHFVYMQHAWVSCGLIRTKKTKLLLGGIGSCARALFRSCYVGSGGLSTTGVALPVGHDGGMVLVFLRCGPLIADEDAVSAVWGGKTASGIVPCLICKNVTKKELKEHLALNAPGIVDITCSDFSQFQINNDTDHWHASDSLRDAAAAMTKGSKGAFKILEQSTGRSWSPHGLLADAELRQFVSPSDSITYDGMHCSMSNGLFQTEVCLFFSKAKAVHGVRFSDVRAYLEQSWTLPVHLGRWRSFVHIFDDARESDEKFGCFASEALCVYPVLRHYVETKLAPLGGLVLESQSFVLMCGMLDLLQAAKRITARSLELSMQLAQSQQAHTEIFLQAYGKTHYKPKGHYLKHVPGQLLRDDGVYLDTFVGERKHAWIKSCMVKVRNTEGFERAVAIDLAVATIGTFLNTDPFADRLEGRLSPCPELAAQLGARDAVVARTMLCAGVHYGVGDMLLCGLQARCVQGCASVGPNMYLILEPLVHIGAVTNTSSMWQRGVGTEVVDAQCIFRQCYHAPTSQLVGASGRILLLH